MALLGKLFGSSSDNTTTDSWKTLTDVGQLNDVKTESHDHPVVLFKHSTRCSISSSALSRLQRNWNTSELGNLELYYLDLIAHRDISSAITDEFGIGHESPQIIFIKDGKAIYNNSHMGINYEDIKELAKAH